MRSRLDRLEKCAAVEYSAEERAAWLQVVLLGEPEPPGFRPLPLADVRRLAGLDSLSLVSGHGLRVAVHRQDEGTSSAEVEPA